MNFLLQVNAGSAKGTNNYVGTNSRILPNITIGIINLHVSRVVSSRDFTLLYSASDQLF